MCVCLSELVLQAMQAIVCFQQQQNIARNAGKHGVDNLTVIVDYNKMQSYGETRTVQELEPLTEKWQAFNFSVSQVDGHDTKQLKNQLSCLPIDTGKPNAIICHTVKGKGVKFAENNPYWHHKSRLSPKQIESLFDELGGRNAKDLS